MHQALRQFRTNMSRARDLSALAAAIEAQTTDALDVTDVLRASIVLAVSALDHLVHELARIGMLQIASGQRPATAAYLRFQVSLQSVTAAQRNNGQEWLDQEIRTKHAWQSFQDPERIADALRCISEKALWQEIGSRLGMNAQDAKTQLKLIVDRRNKIAHEADIDPTAPGCRWPINAAVVVDALQFLDRLATTMVDVVT
jgi:hypothetical protein